MEDIIHDVIVVTGWDKERVGSAHLKAKDIGLPLTEIIKAPVNGYYSFLIGPDGSGEGWPDDSKGEEERNVWKKWVRSEPKLWIDWVHINYGGEEASVPLIKESRFFKEIEKPTASKGDASLLVNLHLLIKAGYRVMAGEEGQYEACHYCGNWLSTEEDFKWSDHAENCIYVEVRKKLKLTSDKIAESETVKSNRLLRGDLTYEILKFFSIRTAASLKDMERLYCVIGPNWMKLADACELINKGYKIDKVQNMAIIGKI